MNKVIFIIIVFLCNSIAMFSSDDLWQKSSFNVEPNTMNSISTHFGKRYFDAWKRRKEKEFQDIQYNKPKRILEKLTKAARNRAEILQDFYDARSHQRKVQPAKLSRIALLQYNKELKK